MPPREPISWAPSVFALIVGELTGWQARPHKTAEEATEHLLSRLYRSGYSILHVDKEAS